MTKFTFHHNIPILRRLYLQRDESRNQREEALRELDVARNQREEALREIREIRDNICLEFSSLQLSHSVPEPKIVRHSKWMSYLSDGFNRPGVRILEIGSRNVTGGATRGPFSAAHYVGFDFYEGENVDVVGDAHKLSSYFDENEKFDLIFSSAVFEHFHMPWIVAQEIQKLLKLGGYVFVETHFSFGAHERPWNFFQFSDMGLRALFNDALGFELIDCGMSNRMNGVFSQEADEYLRGKSIGELYCHSEIFCKKNRDVLDFDWGKSEIDDIVENTRYPVPKTLTSAVSFQADAASLTNGEPTPGPCPLQTPARLATRPPWGDVTFDPADSHFFETVTAHIEGWLQDYAARLTVQILRFQETGDAGKPLVEIGVYAGKYLSLLMASAARTRSTVVGIDTWQYKPVEVVRENLNKLMPDLAGVVRFYGEPSTAFTATRLMEIAGGRPRFISVDGSHDYKDALHDLRLSDAVLDADGIVAVDDFLNPLTIGVNRAVNTLMESRPALEGIAYGYNKLFLSRPEAAGRYRNFVENTLQNETVEQGHHWRERLKTWRGLVEQDFFGHPLLLAGT